jgi:UDP-N-acetylglucosamine 4,6-dehydratase
MKERAKGVLPITDPDMTRFIITLDQGVRFVVKAFEQMEGGEVFVPKIPSVKITDIAKAVAPECHLKTVGIRPGEKMHECMIPRDEARQSMEFDDHYVIKPTFRTWGTKNSHWDLGRPCGREFCYASDTNSEWLNVTQIRKLIAECVDVPASEQVKRAA